MPVFRRHAPFVMSRTGRLPAQHGSAKDPGTVTQRRPQDARAKFRIEQVSPDRGARFFRVENVQIANTATDHNRVGIQHVQNRGECLSEFITQAMERLDGQWFAVSSSASNLRQTNRLATTLEIEPLKRGTGEDRFHASGATAIAGMRLAAHRIVSPLPGNAVKAFENLPADNDSTPNPGSQNDPEHNEFPGSRTQSRLRQRAAIRIIGHVKPSPGLLLQIRAQRPSIQTRGVRILQRSRGRINRPRRANSDHLWSRTFCRLFQALDYPEDLPENVLIAMIRTGLLAEPMNRTVRKLRINNGSFDFCPAEVDSPEQSAHTETRIGMIT